MQISINEHGVVTQHGGVTRVVHGQDPEVGSSPANVNGGVQMRVGGEVLRIVNGQEVTSMGVTRHQEGLVSPSNRSIMATVQRDGRGASVQLIPGLESSRTSLQTAIRDGLVRETSRGIFEDAAPAQVQQPMPAQPPQPAANSQEGGEQAAVPFSFVDSNDMALWNEDVAPIAQHSYDSTVASVVALAGGGTGSLESIANRLAASEGMEPELAQAYVNEGVAFYKDSLSRDLVKGVGLTKDQLEPFYNWAKGKPNLNKALSQLMHGGSTAEFRAMALDYKRESASTTGAATFKAAGFETQVDRASGDLLVRLPGKNWVKARDL